MKIKINERNYEFSNETLSITEILNLLNYTFPIIVVKHKENIIHNHDFDNYVIKDGDEISIMHIFAGG